MLPDHCGPAGAQLLKESGNGECQQQCSFEVQYYSIPASAGGDLLYRQTAELQMQMDKYKDAIRKLRM